MTDIVMPQMGESIVEGTLTKWLKKPGERIERDEPLFEISTDKVDAEIPSPVAGVLSEIKVTEGATVQINTVVAVVTENGEAVAAPIAAEGEPAPEAPAAARQKESQISLPSMTALVDYVLTAGKKGLSVQRYKGLGEMNPDQLWETTMNPDKRTLLQVRVEDAVEADIIFTTLMGDQVEPRRDFIYRNALNVSNLDV